MFDVRHYRNIRDDDNRSIDEITDLTSHIFLVINSSSEILLSDLVIKSIIIPHLAHLRDNDYECIHDSPLFPIKTNKSAYDEKSLERHLKEYTKDFGFNEIRLAGKDKYYNVKKEGDKLSLDGIKSYRLKTTIQGKRPANIIEVISEKIKDVQNIIEVVKDIENIIVNFVGELNSYDLFWSIARVRDRIVPKINLPPDQIEELMEECFKAINRQTILPENLKTALKELFFSTFVDEQDIPSDIDAIDAIELRENIKYIPSQRTRKKSLRDRMESESLEDRLSKYK